MFESIYSHYFSIDIETEDIVHNDDTTFLQNVEIFVQDQLSDLYTADSNREYGIVTNTTQVVNNIGQMIYVTSNDARIEYAYTIAQRLLREEKSVQERIAQLAQDIQKGGLIITCFKKDSEEYFALVKIHYIDFYEEETFKEQRGLPKKDVILKTAICKIHNKSIVGNFFLSDSTKPKGPGAAKFWWDGFLELAPLINDTENTKNAFAKVDGLLKKEFHKENREDYWFFRNNLVSYLRTEEYFVFSEMINRTFGNLDIQLLEGENNEEKSAFRDSLESKMLSLNTQNGKRIFDAEFNIDSKAVQAKIKRNITLFTNVELSIKGEIDDFKNRIVAENDNGRKYLKIYTDAGYDTFKSK